MATGRFAPSPTGPLHLGNLRTGLLAWLFARSAGSRFAMRVEDLDAHLVRPGVEDEQLADLVAIGVDWDGPIVHQSERRAAHETAIQRLEDAGLTYPCFCTRREILKAAAAPHDQPAPEGAYPGTCRDLTPSEQRVRAEERPAALRLRAAGEVVTVQDRLHGPVTVAVDDLVLRRNDGTPAYNLAVVVDDGFQGIEEVVRADDLLLSSPRQAHLATLLDLPVPAYAHVPLVLGPAGERLAKRDGAVTLADRAALGQSADEVRSLLAASVGLAEPGEPVTPAQLLARFDPDALPREPWVLPPP
jgi:glutamyl-tRNA synthetase